MGSGCLNRVTNSQRNACSHLLHYFLVRDADPFSESSKIDHAWLREIGCGVDV